MAERYRIAADIDSVGIADKNQFFKTDLPDFVFTCWTAGENNVADDFTVAVEKCTGRLRCRRNILRSRRLKRIQAYMNRV